MKNFDPTPDGVTYYRINAAGFGVSIFAMFGAIYWWVGMYAPIIYDEPIALGILAGTALVTGAFYALPALVPRKTWGYFVAFIQLALSLTSMTATLPSLAVLIKFGQKEVREWFEGRPLGFARDRGGARTAMITALVGYYAIVSAVPFGIAHVFRPGHHIDEVVAEVAKADEHVTFDNRAILTEEPLDGAVDFEAETLLTGSEWSLSDERGPVAVTVWASYCHACDAQMKRIAESPDTLGASKHVTLALDCEGDDWDNRQSVEAKLNDSGITSLALCDVNDDGLDVEILPTTVFFDSDGQRRATAQGYQTTETLAEVADAIE